MPAMSRWWRSSGCRWRGWSIAAANSSSGGGGQASGPERGDHLVLGDRVGRQQLRPGALLGPELAQPQLAAVLEPDQHPRGAVFGRGPFVEDAQSAGRHQVDQQRQVAELDHRHLADPPHPADLAPDQRFQRRVEGLHHVHPRRQGRFHDSSDKLAFSCARRSRPPAARHDESAPVRRCGRCPRTDLARPQDTSAACRRG